jgi:hypothetical protein
MSLEKTTAIAEKTALVFRIDAFDLLNHVNFGNPTLTATGSATSTFGQISSTRTAVGDAGSSRQLQLAMRFEFWQLAEITGNFEGARLKGRG